MLYQRRRLDQVVYQFNRHFNPKTIALSTKGGQRTGYFAAYPCRPMFLLLNRQRPFVHTPVLTLRNQGTTFCFIRSVTLRLASLPAGWTRDWIAQSVLAIRQQHLRSARTLRDIRTLARTIGRPLLRTLTGPLVSLTSTCQRAILFVFNRNRLSPLPSERVRRLNAHATPIDPQRLLCQQLVLFPVKTRLLRVHVASVVVISPILCDALVSVARAHTRKRHDRQLSRIACPTHEPRYAHPVDDVADTCRELH